MDVGNIRKPLSSEKGSVFLRAEGVRATDRTEICDVARRTQINVLGAENSLIITLL